MERLRGPINSFFFEEEMSSECMEPGAVTTSSTLEMGFGNLSPQMPFLQMLQGAMQAEEETEEETEENQLHFKLHQHSQALFTSYPPETNLQLLLRLQDHHHQINRTAEIESCKAVEQLDSCITHASESQSDTKGLVPARAIVGPRERKKRKRSRVPAVTKNAQEVESQRMTHIAVERNRRRLMNDHLIALRSLMPSSFVQRGDQASIIGGAIDFVKELEQLLLSLQAEKRMRAASESTTTMTSSSGSSSCTTLFRSNDEDDASHVATASLSGFFISPQYTSYSEFQRQQARRRGIMAQQTKEEGEEGLGVDVEATVVQGHVNLKVAGRRRAGQLVRAIAAMEELRLSVLHLNITSLDSSSILYSLNLKMEEECKLGSADEIATAMHQIFTYISGR